MTRSWLRLSDVIRRFWADSRFAWRALRRRPALTVAASATLAIGIGATTVIFTVADAVLLTPLPYPQPERLLFVSSSFPGATGGGDQLSYLDVREIAERARTLEAVEPYHTNQGLQLRGGTGQPERVRGNLVGPRYLELLGARAALGRLLGPQDDRAENAHPVAVITHSFWTSRLGGDPAILGKPLVLNDVALTVVGVLAPQFRDVSAEEGYAFDSDVFIPVQMVPSFAARTMLSDRSARNFWALARLKDGVSIADGKADVAAIGDVLQRERADTNRGFSFWGERLDTYLARDLRTPILLLMAGSAFVLLVAAANVANLLLARLSARAREIAVRRAIGAQPGQIVSLVLAESAVLSVIGGLGGVLLAAVCDDLFRQLVPGELTPRIAAVGLDMTALAFAAAVTLAVAVAIGGMAGIRAAFSRRTTTAAFTTRGASASDGGRTRQVLLIAEVAIALVLAIGAWLMLDSLRNLRRSDLGFRTERLMTVQLDLRSAKYVENATVARFGEQLVAELQATPGVESAMVWGPARPGRSTWITFPGREDTPVTAERVMTWRHSISPGALGAIGIPLRAGREFTAADNLTSPRVVIVSETIARTFWPGEEAVGKRLRWRADQANSPLLTVVGVAADARQRGRINSLLYPARDVYVPHAQRAERMVVVVVRARSDPAAITGAVRGVVSRLDPELPVFNIGTLQQYLAEEEAETRFTTVLLSTYGVVAVLLAAIGIYGVLSYLVTLRRAEVAVRVALGATTADVLRLIVGAGMRPALAGVLIGIAGSAVLTRFLGTLLFGVSPRDPFAFAAMGGILFAVALLATVLPARAALGADPATVLRSEGTL